MKAMDMEIISIVKYKKKKICIPKRKSYLLRRLLRKSYEWLSKRILNKFNEMETKWIIENEI